MQDRSATTLEKACQPANSHMADAGLVGSSERAYINGSYVKENKWSRGIGWAERWDEPEVRIITYNDTVRDLLLG